MEVNNLPGGGLIFTILISEMLFKKVIFTNGKVNKEIKLLAVIKLM